MTPIGRELAPVLERILRDLDSALLNIRALSSGASGSVTIAALPSLSATVLPGSIAAFRKENPAIAIHLRDAVGIKIAGMVRAGEVDFGFGSLPVSEPDVEFTPLFNDHMSAIFPRHSPLGEKRTLTLKQRRSLNFGRTRVARTVCRATARLVGAPRTGIVGGRRWRRQFRPDG